MKYHYWTKARGIGGRIDTPEDFRVKEILHQKYFAKYKVSSTVVKAKGKYNLFLLRKRNMTTQNALKILVRISSVAVFPTISPTAFKPIRNCWETISGVKSERNSSTADVNEFNALRMASV